MKKVYTLNQIFEEEKKNALLKRRETATQEELQKAEQSVREAECGLNDFCQNISAQIPSSEQAAAVFEEISASENSVEMLLRIRQLLRFGIRAANQRYKKLDPDTIDVLKRSIEDFDREIVPAAAQ